MPEVINDMRSDYMLDSNEFEATEEELANNEELKYFEDMEKEVSKELMQLV